MFEATRFRVPAAPLVPRLGGARPTADAQTTPGALSVEVLGMEAFARARLPERERRALRMVEEQGATYKEVATSLGTSWEAVKQLVYRGRRQLLDDVERTGRLLAFVAPAVAG